MNGGGLHCDNFKGYYWNFPLGGPGPGILHDDYSLKYSSFVVTVRNTDKRQGNCYAKCKL